MPLDALVDPSIQRLTAVSYKRYPLSSKIRLSLNFPKAKNGFDKTILSRRSIKEFSNRSLTVPEITKLIYFSNGITKSLNLDYGIKQHFRVCPSAGALYPIELYVIALNVAKLAVGIYHYDPVENNLEFKKEMLRDMKHVRS